MDKIIFNISKDINGEKIIKTMYYDGYGNIIEKNNWYNSKEKLFYDLENEFNSH